MFTRFIVLLFFFSGCATHKYRPLSPPSNAPAPIANTGKLDSNLKTLETTLDRTKSRLGRINVLLDSLQLD